MKPKRIILIRHGESEGNVDKLIYMHKPDYALMLTEKGKGQATETGKKLLRVIGTNQTYGVYYSPFFRARQTMDIALLQLKNSPILFKKEDVRLREQEWSNGLRKEDLNEQKLIEFERDMYGHYYYRFYGGESCADCENRVSDFLHTLHRDFKKPNFPRDILIFAHGMLNRIFIKKWLHATVEEFETWANPHNGEFHILELTNDGNHYKLITPLRKHEIKHKYQYNFKI